MNRTKKAARNVIISMIGYACVVVSGFIARTAILRYMGIEMVGVGQLFSNIFMLLSYSSLGLETSIVYSLYEPLQQNDADKVCIIMNFYKKCFRYIEGAIIALTVLLLPVVPFMVKDSENIQDIYLILILYGLTSASSYFYAYKRSIIVADQNRYMSTLFSDISAVIKLLAQVLIISLTQSYTLYMLTNVIVVISNMLVARVAEIKYPYLSNHVQKKMVPAEKKELIRTTIAIVEQKLGFVVVFAIDSILMSAFLGMSVVGMYSNYLMVINGLQAGIIIVFQSVTAGIGNLAITEDNVKLKASWNVLNFIGYWIYAFSTVCLVVLFNPFIQLWLGENYTFSMPILLLLVLHYYVEGMRKPVITYKDAIGIQWNDRWKPVVEVILNVIFSLLFIRWIGGIAGILLAMSLSMLLTSCWIEPYMLYKYGLHAEIGEYFKNYTIQCVIVVLMTIITLLCASKIDLLGSGILYFGLKLVICIIVPNAIFVMCFCKSPELKSVVQIVKGLLMSGRKKGNGL